jgi:Rrf2 family transcriptional regulator, nitric oxide-sensitive transcriptional repressor
LIQIKRAPSKVHTVCIFSVRLTTFTDYSLRVLMYVAAAPARRSTISEVAEAFAISESHLVKVVHLLGKEGLLLNTRGRGGGLRLARAPDEISIGRVVRATERGDYAAECFDSEHNTCKLAGRCRLQRALEEAVAGFYAVLDKYSLEDMRLRPAKLEGVLRWRPRA